MTEENEYIEQLLLSDDPEHNCSGRLAASGVDGKLICWVEEELKRGTDVGMILIAWVKFSSLHMSNIMVRYTNSSEGDLDMVFDSISNLTNVVLKRATETLMAETKDV